VAGALVASLLGAVGALIYYRQKQARAASSGEVLPATAAQDKLPLGRLATLVFAVVRLIREIVDLAQGE